MCRVWLQSSPSPVTLTTANRVVMATKFDRDSFYLLNMADSGSESVLDHSFEISHQSRNKKKVRLKRTERKTSGSIGVNGIMGKLHEACCWFTTCTNPPSQILQLTWKSVGGTNAPRADNFSSHAPAAFNMHLSPIHSYLFGISGISRPTFALSNLAQVNSEGS